MKFNPRYSDDRFIECVRYASEKTYHASDRVMHSVGKKHRSEWVDHMTKEYYLNTMAPDLRYTKRIVWVNKC